MPKYSFIRNNLFPCRGEEEVNGYQANIYFLNLFMGFKCIKIHNWTENAI